METVQAWDRALRGGDWEASRALLTDDATYTTPEASEDERIMCETPDEIVDLMRSWKGKMPDVQVVEWDAVGDHVVARLRQPAFGEDADWYQVLSVRDRLIAKLRDYPTREAAFDAASGPVR